MRKDIEWLKKEIGAEMLQLEPNRNERWSDVKYQTLRSVAQKINELDKPEVLSQEWIDEYAQGDYDEWVYVEDLENLLISKQELPVIPQFMANWIEKYTEYGYDLYPVLKKMEDNSRIWKKTYDWYRKNTHKFVNAYLTGRYEVEEEQKYNVQLKVKSASGTVGIFLYKQGDKVLAGDNFGAYYPEKNKFRLTEQEIRDYDERYWPFAVEVAE